jgi:CheY-like chemotaxis protein
MISKTLRVLLADDDVDDRSFFDKALKELPIDTHLNTVNDGDELILYLTKNINAENVPDVVFLDLSMPRKSGFECLVDIKEINELKDIPIVMFSTSFPHDFRYEDSLIKTLLSMGAESYIRKQGDFESLKHAIHQTLIRISTKSVTNENELTNKIQNTNL